MNKTVAFLWSVAFVMQLVSCIKGDDPQWVSVLVPIGCIVICSWTVDLCKDK